MGVQKMTKEHIGLCLFLKIPFFVVLTKIDIAPENKMEETIDELKRILKSRILNKLPIMIKENTSEEVFFYFIQELTKTAEIMSSSGKVCPIFPISSVTGKGVDRLTDFISQLTTEEVSLEKLNKQPFEFEINETFLVEGVGLVVSGIVRSGVAKLNKACLLGPDKVRNFKQVSIKSIHVSRHLREEAYAGELVCMCIKSQKANEKLIRKEIRRGMVIIDANNKPVPV